MSYGQEPDFEPEKRAAGRALRRALLGLLIVVAVGLGLYYPIGMLAVHTIDDDPDFAIAPPPVGASRAVAMVAALIEREVDRNHWVASDQFFMPGWMLDNMPNYQTGIVAALARITAALGEQAAKPRGGRVDADIDRAAGLLRYPGNVWIVDVFSGFGATASSAAQYRTAYKALGAYNERLAAKRAAFERRADTLATVLDAVAGDVDTYAALLDKQIAEAAGNLLDFSADDLFYTAKGRLYAHSLVLRELGQDFDRVLAEKKAEASWKRMVEALKDAASLHPWFVINGAPDSLLLPSHLAGLGYAVLRARARIAETATLLK